MDLLEKEFGVSNRFIRLCLQGERHSDNAIEICERYNELEKKIKKVILEAEKKGAKKNSE